MLSCAMQPRQATQTAYKASCAEEYILNKVYLRLDTKLSFPMKSNLNRAQTVRRIEALFALGFLVMAELQERTADRAEL